VVTRTDGRPYGALVAECEEQFARLTAARASLAHLLTCPSGHPTARCPHPAEEIDGRLLNGHVPPAPGSAET
jgi:hypothetical protein